MDRNTQIYPFSTLSKEKQKEITPHFSYEKIKQGTTLVEQDITVLDRVYILTQGSACFFYNTGYQKIMADDLKLNECFGGLAILYNEGIATRSLEVTSDSSFVSLPAHLFLSLCKESQAFFDHFAKEFGICMANKSFAGIIARQHKDRLFNLPFFNRPIRSIFRPNIITSQTDESISQACRKMAKHDSGAILIKAGKKEVAGIVTDADLKHRVLAKDMDGSEPVKSIMSAPIISVSADSQVFEAFLAMAQHDKRHLAVHGQNGDITGILSEKDLIAAQTSSTYLLIKKVKNANSIRDIENIHAKLETMLLDPIKNGANPDYITRLISAFSDAIIDKIIRFSLDRMGNPPPCKFVFLTMGSEGREEQTLISDQDNAIVFEDTQHNDKAKAYFDRLAALICDQLDMAGYRYCDGNNMAKNSQWCQPLSEWKNYFHTWIRSSTPERLLHSSIFFDFRGTWGHLPLAENLKQFLLDSISKWSGFLRNMTENTLFFKPPIGLFGKIQVETEGDKKGALDIKTAILPIIDFARIYALKNGISQTNTLTRLFRLYTRHAITAKEYTDIVRSYNYLMNLRFVRQITMIFDEGLKPDNHIYPDSMSNFDRLLLKEMFKMVEKLQQKLGVEFTGVI